MRNLRRSMKRIFDLKDDNTGFTMVELLTAVSIFACFSIALMNYMHSASNINSQVSALTSLEMQAEVSMGILEEYVIEASTFVEFKDNTLFIVNKSDYVEGGGASTSTADGYMHAFRFVPASGTTKGELYYNSGEVTLGVSGSVALPGGGDYALQNYTLNESTLTGWEKLTDGVTAFHVDIHEVTTEFVKLVPKNDGSNDLEEEILYTTNTGSALLTYTIENNRGNTYDGQSYITLRNNPSVGQLSVGRLLA